MNLREEIARLGEIRSGHHDEGAREYEDAYNRALAERLVWTDRALLEDMGAASSGWRAWSPEYAATMREIERRGRLSAHECFDETRQRLELRGGNE